MKRSNQPTAYLLVKANTNSYWDSCDYAIVHITQQWKEQLQERIKFLSPLQGDYDFQSMRYYDCSADFYRIGEDGQSVAKQLPKGRSWAFVELDENEQEAFIPPENHLDSYAIVLCADGTGYYSAYGKHTGEEFWTEKILFTQIIQ